MTAVATAAGAMAPMAHMAVAGAQPDGATAAMGQAGLAGPASFESCSPYFGFGKEEGVLGVVEFDVADVNGDDGVAHDVDDDTEVRLVLENDEGDILECVPFEVTTEQWNEEFGEDPDFPAHPGPGHYVYPSVNLEPEIKGFGLVVQAGFRVVTIPEQHTLVSPEGVHELDDVYLDPEETFFGTIVDQDLLDYIAGEANQDAADAYEAALLACDDDAPYNDEDPDLLAAARAIDALVGDEEEYDSVSCFGVDFRQFVGSFTLSAYRSVEYVEPIRLSVPEDPSDPPATPPVPTDPTTPQAPAARPTTATPTFTG